MAEESRFEYVSRIMDPRTYGITFKLDSPEAVGEALTRLRSGGVNVLGPEARIDYIPRFHQVSLRWDFIDTLAEGNWYPQAGGGLSMYFVALNRLATMAGITWSQVERDDDGSIPLYWRVRIGASVKLLDGSVVPHFGLGEADLRDGSAESLKVLSESKGDAKKAEGTLLRMRAKGSQRCESIAKAGLIRKILAVRAKYNKDEAEMPFVWPTLVFAPPPDPELDRALMFKAAGLAEMLYPRANVIDTTATVVQPRQLEERAPVRDFRAESERLAQRERVPVEQAEQRAAAPPQAAAPAPTSRPAGYGRPAAPPADDRMPWDDDEPVGDPATPSKRVTWEGTPYTAEEIRAFCASRTTREGISSPWPDITIDESRANVAKFVAWAESEQGSRALAAYVARK